MDMDASLQTNSEEFDIRPQITLKIALEEIFFYSKLTLQIPKDNLNGRFLSVPYQAGDSRTVSADPSSGANGFSAGSQTRY
jgi:hypothetical protein